MGHDLVIEVGSWEATLVVGPESSITLDADGGSLTVIEGTGGAKALSDKDKKSIAKSIDSDILKKAKIEFRSNSVSPSDDGSQLTVAGDLTLVGQTAPVDFTISVADDGQLTGSATVTQTTYKIEPYSALFGALKVLDDVEVVIVDCSVPTT